MMTKIEDDTRRNIAEFLPSAIAKLRSEELRNTQLARSRQRKKLCGIPRGTARLIKFRFHFLSVGKPLYFIP